jgi:hypothetical protein
MLGFGKESARARSAGKGCSSTMDKMNRRFASISSRDKSGSAPSRTEWSTFTLRNKRSQGRIFEFPLDRIVVPCETILYGTVRYCIVPYSSVPCYGYILHWRKSGLERLPTARTWLSLLSGPKTVSAMFLRASTWRHVEDLNRASQIDSELHVALPQRGASSIARGCMRGR